MARRGARTLPDLNTMSLARLYGVLTRGGLVRRLAMLARDEDLGANGDVTSEASVRAGARGTGKIVARAPGVVAGLRALEEFRRVLAPRCVVVLRARDGGRVGRGRVLADVRGPLREVLAFERTALNLLGRLSGIATRTAEFVGAMPRGSRARLYDTRKTTPGLRVLEKYAVRCGGGRCHRVGLHDAVLVKDNHVAGAGPADLGVYARRVARTARRGGALRFVEIEVDTIGQLESVLRAQHGADGTERVDIVLLDNMAPGVLRRAATLRDKLAPRVELEASGGVGLSTLPAIARSGVDRMSAGTLTHGAAWLDVALDLDAPRRGERGRR